MRKLIALLVFVLLTNECFSQRKQVDSLSKLLPQQKQDTGKVMILNSLAIAYWEMLNHDSAMYFAKKGLDISRQAGFKKGEASSLHIIATQLADKGNKARALELYLQALKINENLGEFNGMSRNLNNIGIIYQQQGGFTAALRYFLPSLSAWEKEEQLFPNTANINNSAILGNIAFCYRNLNMYDSARYYAQKAYQKGKDKNNILLTATGLSHMGMISAEEGQYGIGLEYLREAIRLTKDNRERERRVWLNIATVFEKAGQLDSALHYARLSYAIALQAQLPLRIDQSATLLARIYKKLNNKDSSLYYLEMSVAARDTLAVREQRAEVDNLTFNEKFRQQEIAETQKKEKEERKRNLQYAAIAFVLVSFLILFFVFSHSVMANPKLIRFLGILSLLIVFEFINLFIHPYMDRWTNHSISLMLGIMVAIAALLIPLHHKLEHWITHRLVEKNNKIRLAAAKKTIAKLEG